MSHYFKHKLHPIQHGVLKYKSTATNLVTYLDFIFALVSSQRHVDSIYFDLSSAFNLVRILFYSKYVGCSESNAPPYFFSFQNKDSNVEIEREQHPCLLRTCIYLHGRPTDSAAVIVCENGVCV
jgi:hypothetical protein